MREIKTEIMSRNYKILTGDALRLTKLDCNVSFQFVLESNGMDTRDGFHHS